MLNQETVLKRSINKALKQNPPEWLDWIYGDYFSPYYNLMRLLANSIKNCFLVELGVHTGRGLASLGAGNRTNTVVGFDTQPCSNIQKIQKEYPNVIFFQKASLPTSSLINREINLLHIDTEHSYATAKAEFEGYKSYLTKGAYVLFDDLHAENDGVLRYFESLPYYKIQEDKLHPICGYGVLIYE
jgi:hypothetical protein